MATSIDKDIEDIINCQLCLLNLEDPKILKCLHYFCLKCLVKMSDDADGRSKTYSVKCPVCKQITQLSEHGAASLPRFYFVDKVRELLEKIGVIGSNGKTISPCEIQSSITKDVRHCLLCQKTDLIIFCDSCKGMFCTNCATSHDKSLTSHETCSVAEAEKEYCLEVCKIHSDKANDIYCIDCSEPICVLCSIIKHPEHSVEPLKESCEKSRREAEEMIEKLRERMTKMKKNVDQLNETKLSENVKYESETDKIKDKASEQIKEIQLLERQLLAKSEERHEKNIGNLESSTIMLSKKMSAYSEQIDKAAVIVGEMTVNNFKSISKNFKSLLHFAEDSVETIFLGTSQQLTDYQSMQSHMLFGNGQADILDSLPVDESTLDTTFSNNDEKTEPKTVAHVKTRATRLFEITADNVVGTVITKNRELVIACNNINIKKVEIIIVKDGTSETLITFDGNASSFTSKNGDQAVLALPEQGEFYRFSLMDWLHGAEKRYETFSFQNSSLNKCLVSCIDNKWAFIVVDPIKNHVTKITFSSHIFSQHTFQLVGRRSERDGRFNTTCDLAIGKNDDIIICDNQLARLVVFDKNSKFKGYIAHPGSFEKPQAISISEDGHIYVADGKTHQVKEIALSGEVVFNCLTDSDGHKNPIMIHYRHGYMSVVMEVSEGKHVVALYAVAE